MGKGDGHHGISGEPIAGTPKSDDKTEKLVETTRENWCYLWLWTTISWGLSLYWVEFGRIGSRFCMEIVVSRQMSKVCKPAKLDHLSHWLFGLPAPGFWTQHGSKVLQEVVKFAGQNMESISDLLISYHLWNMLFQPCPVCPESIQSPEDCAFVIRFNKFNTTKSHIQGSGRARHENADAWHSSVAVLVEFSCWVRRVPCWLNFNRNMLKHLVRTFGAEQTYSHSMSLVIVI